MSEKWNGSARYWALSRVLDILNGIRRAFSENGLNLTARKGCEGAYDELGRLCEAVREMMTELR